jgi:hypothetical protein
MSWSAMANTIRSRFKTQIADVYSLITQYDNQSLDLPDNEMCCRHAIDIHDSNQVSIGSPSSQRYRSEGMMMVQLFAPIGKGDGDLLELADAIDTAFSCITDSGVTFKKAKPSKGRRSDNRWMVNVYCPFYADDIG